ncbi:Hypothetical_protein [Hexamita inflata]|uniref:Hypothetical_protein n=1 Tax=Hexamita inflata TaxID=28002 RepID=A0AA86QE83_9EUKA|nr:Hypothetical protein HINF_LOCUS44083 [Hexamita inflata]
MKHSTIDYYENSYDEKTFLWIYDDGQVGKFYFSCQGSATKKNHKLNTQLSKITNFCIINLENFIKKIKFDKTKMNSAQNLITFKLSSQLNRLNLAANDFIAFSVTNNVFE